jgi:hypothetical protein
LFPWLVTLAQARSARWIRRLGRALNYPAAHQPADAEYSVNTWWANLESESSLVGNNVATTFFLVSTRYIKSGMVDSASPLINRAES